MRYVEKYDNIAHAHCTLTICNTYCFSTATVVARTRCNVTFYVHCLCCQYYFQICSSGI